MVSGRGGETTFTILNIGSGGVGVSSGSEVSIIQNKAILSQWDNSLYFNDFVNMIGWDFVNYPEGADIDLSLDKINKDTFIKIFD